MHVSCYSLDNCEIGTDGMMTLATALSHCPNVEILRWAKFVQLMEYVTIDAPILETLNLYTLIRFCICVMVAIEVLEMRYFKYCVVLPL